MKPIKPHEREWMKQCPLRVWLDRPPRYGRAVALASKIGCHRATLHGWLYGQHSIGAEYADAFVEATGITLEAMDQWLKSRPRRGRGTNKRGDESWEKQTV